MLSGIVHNFGSQIRRSPCSQSSRKKNEQRTSEDYDSGEHDCLWDAGGDRRGNQMPQRDNERNVVEDGNAKPNEINRANDPKPFFELELGRAHSAFVAEPPLRCNPPLLRQSDETTNRLPSLSLNIA